MRSNTFWGTLIHLWQTSAIMWTQRHCHSHSSPLPPQLIPPHAQSPPHPYSMSQWRQKDCQHQAPVSAASSSGGLVGKSSPAHGHCQTDRWTFSSPPWSPPACCCPACSSQAAELPSIQYWLWHHDNNCRDRTRSRSSVQYWVRHHDNNCWDRTQSRSSIQHWLWCQAKDKVPTFHLLFLHSTPDAILSSLEWQNGCGGNIAPSDIFLHNVMHNHSTRYTCMPSEARNTKTICTTMKPRETPRKPYTET